VLIEKLSKTFDSKTYEFEGTIDHMDRVSISSDGRRIGIFSKLQGDRNFSTCYSALRVRPNAAYDELYRLRFRDVGIQIKLRLVRVKKSIDRIHLIYQDMKSFSNLNPYSTHRGFVCQQQSQKRSNRSNFWLFYGAYYDTQSRTSNPTASHTKPWVPVCEDSDIVNTFILPDDSEVYILQKSDTGLVIMRYLVRYGDMIDIIFQESCVLGCDWVEGSDFTVIRRKISPKHYAIITQPTGTVKVFELNSTRQ